MFYPELLKINNDIFSEIIERMDSWFAFLPLNERDKITASKVANKFDIDYDAAYMLLEKCVKLNVLGKRYGITCPECNHILKVTSIETLYEDVDNVKDCYCCDSEDISISSEDIVVIYNVTRKPTNSPDRIRKLASKRLDVEEPILGKDSLAFSIEMGATNPNSIFYNPTDEETKKLEELYRDLKGDFKNTKSQGDSLENLVLYMLNLVKVFKATSVKTPTNQIDCLCRNKLWFKSSIFEEIGTFFIAECKNEKEDNVSNTYYHKIIDIISLMKFHNERKFGVVFSINPPTKPCHTIARETFLNKDILVISVSKPDLKRIIHEKHNLLDVFEEKIFYVKTNSTTDLREAGIF